MTAREVVEKAKLVLRGPAVFHMGKSLRHAHAEPVREAWRALMLDLGWDGHDARNRLDNVRDGIDQSKPPPRGRK